MEADDGTGIHPEYIDNATHLHVVVVDVVAVVLVAHPHLARTDLPRLGGLPAGLALGTTVESGGSTGNDK
jgi:hypothetical protein